MDRGAANAFVYAKASGLLAKSFVSKNASSLFQVKSLSELWTLIFKTPAPLVPEVLLAEKIEEEAFNKFISDYTYFISLYDKPASSLIDQLFVFEVENLKEVGDSLCAGEKSCPKLLNLGKFNTLHCEKWPDIKKITEGTDYAWFNTVPSIHEQQKFEYKLDLQTAKHIWNSVQELKGEGADEAKDLIRTQLVLKNVIWALRLKINYQMPDKEIIPELIYVTERPTLKDPISNMAIKILQKDVEKFDDWKNWKYSSLVNPQVEGEIWKISSAWIEKSARILQNRKASRLFHNYPLTEVALLGWYKMKEFELTCIRMAVEAIRLGVNDINL